MAEHEELYDDARAERLKVLLRRLAYLIQERDRTDALLDASAELQRLLGEDALSGPFTLEDPEDEEPWRRPRPAD
jgi:hypothetical protein